ncbi:unnamed protein product [Spirodela intermedia]|uniref:Uncharacterized protein n=1 Tax=Spirodela intermedia TaxID=51605 RepID=A0A7I8LCF6_SPIIN|nr:unnamed protein product [Spirodela intermedia]
MRTWVKFVVSMGAPAGAILLVLFSAIAVCRHRRRQKPSPSDAYDNKPPLNAKPTRLTLKEGIFRLRLSLRSEATGLGFQSTHRNHRHHHDGHLRRPRSDFSWADQPHLAADAAACGWSRFVFLDRDEPPTRRGSLLSSCVACEVGRSNPAAAADCEMPVGSSEFMQTVRIYPHGNGSGFSGIRMNLPLPGPQLGDDSAFFPAEAYFEIIILHLQPLSRRRHQLRRIAQRKGSCGDGDRRKLIHDNPAAVLIDESSQGDADSISPVQEQEEEEAEVVVCLGLTEGGGPPDSPPGSYPGSIGFNSRGCVNLDGINLVSESEKKTQWGAVNRIIGCGFNPRKKTVFFTVDSLLLHVVRCNSDAFRCPLYPAMAANVDVVASVNLGQRPFKYAPANARRLPAKPALASPLPSEPSPRIGYDDSGELFSMARIQDSLWLPGSRKRTPLSGSRRTAAGDEEEARWDCSGDAESDLFEISLTK